MDRMSVIGLGQPMLDLVCEVPEWFLERHNLEKNSAVRTDALHSGETIFSLVRQNTDTKYVPGGSTTNTLKIASKLLRKSNRTVGCIGKLLVFVPG